MEWGAASASAASPGSIAGSPGPPPHQVVVEREQPPHRAQVGVGARRQGGARDGEDPLAVLRLRQLDRDDVEGVAGLVAQHRGAAVPGRGQAPDRSLLLELGEDQQGGPLELPARAGLESALRLHPARGRQLVERQQALEQLPEVDGLPLHPASLPAGRPLNMREKPRVEGG